MLKNYFGAADKNVDLYLPIADYSLSLEKVEKITIDITERMFCNIAKVSSYVQSCPLLIMIHSLLLYIMEVVYNE